jgi:hypothetical protein
MQVMKLTLIKASAAEEVKLAGMGEVRGLTFESGLATIYVEWNPDQDHVGKVFQVISPGQDIPKGATFVAAAMDRGQFRMLYEMPVTELHPGRDEESTLSTLTRYPNGHVFVNGRLLADAEVSSFWDGGQFKIVITAPARTHPLSD